MMSKERRRVLGLGYDLAIALMGVLSYLFSYITISILNSMVELNLAPELINILSASIFFLISWYGLGIIINHRAMGPMGAVKRHFSIVANGDYYVNFKLRKGDDLSHISAHVNDMTKSLTDHEKESIARLDRIKTELNDLLAKSQIQSVNVSLEVGHFVETLVASRTKDGPNTIGY